MQKYTYIKSQLAKTNKKNDENYVITRIWHKLDNEDIKFVTQQYVIRQDGRYALTDMYFPQINLHVEIDEGYHQNAAQLQKDKIRENDIISITDHEIKRIAITGNLSSINEQIDHLVAYINDKIKQMGKDFIPWDIEKEFSPQTYIEKGSIKLSDNVAFRTCAHVANVFGHSYNGYQRGGTKHPYYNDVMIWFPKLFPNGEWDNSISPDGKVIRERNVHEEKVDAHINDVINNQIHRRIVFAKVKGPLGEVMYKFKGEFELDILLSKQERCLIWKRISDTVKTFPPK
ncbi:AbaSI family restriction endonuclease [Lysinibacillus sp. BW-2-10]|uniref:AbaSI family restriction endonuclease n=1 Tax=Lysinibacillus sp. BW-2-10 TaxID=2590030 RepID=UPI00117CC5F4|nr:hypothetical protein [Lysinibacillus sp. BW-2-10]TSI11081.1 hypothetical protein FJQ64_02590 [Lysinibacillus sp. BW-2-10]